MSNKPETIAEKPLSRSSTIWAAIVAGASFVAGLVDQLAPFVPPKYRDLFLYLGGIASAIGLWRARATSKAVAQGK